MADAQTKWRRTGQGMGTLLTVLLGLPLLLGACGQDSAAERELDGADRRMRPGMTDGAGEGMMGGMMQGMMESMPEGIPASALPEPGSGGARLVARYCGQCHGIPTPARLSAAEWPATLRRMVLRMDHMESMGERMGMRGGMMGDVQAPTPEERERMLAYLEAHALRVASEDDLPADDPAAALFASTCSRCHALPHPAQHTPGEWAAVVERMRANMRRMGVDGVTDEQAETITRYLERAAADDASGP